VEKHEAAVADVVALVAAGPEACPFSEGIGAACGAASDGLLDAEVDFDDAASGNAADRGDLAEENYPGGVGEVEECVFECGRKGSGGGVVLRKD
jgi:hypothetical protein